MAANKNPCRCQVKHDDYDDAPPPYEPLPPPSYADFCAEATAAQKSDTYDDEGPAQRPAQRPTIVESDSDFDDSNDSEDAECGERSEGCRCNRKRAIRHRALLMHYLNRLRNSHARQPENTHCEEHAYEESPCQLTYYHDNASTDYCCDTRFLYTMACDRDRDYDTTISQHTITLAELKDFANAETTRMDDESEQLFSELLDAVIRTQFKRKKLCAECSYDSSGYPHDYVVYFEYVEGSGKSVCYVNDRDFVDFKYVYVMRCRCGKSIQVTVNTSTIDQYHIDDHMLNSLHIVRHGISASLFF